MDFKKALVTGEPRPVLPLMVVYPDYPKPNVPETPKPKAVPTVPQRPKVSRNPKVRAPAVKPRKGLTENGSPTYLSSGNACLDFFFHVVPDTPHSEIYARLKSSWARNPLTTLKLICNLRGVRGTGKSDKEGFYTSALWLHRHHPKTLASNLPAIASFGCFKDFLEILFRVIQGADARSKLNREWKFRKATKSRRAKALRKTQIRLLYGGRGGGGGRGRGPTVPIDQKDKKSEASKKRWRAQFSREQRIGINQVKLMKEKQMASRLRKQKQNERTQKVVDMYNNNRKFRFLHEQISTFFADMLTEDIKFLNSGHLNKISLASKWCPSIDSSYDKYTLICASIANKMFPRESCPEYHGLEDAKYVYRVRDRLRKEVLVPLHKALKLPEVYICAKQWNSIAYNRVASIAMKNYTDKFKSQDNERFNNYLEDVKKGKAKIAAGALFPHEILGTCYYDATEEQITVAELQWKRMVDDMLKKGRLTNCIAICDVSGSMTGTPIKVAVALGLLVSELSDEPWKGQLITFSHNPQLHLIQGNSLREKSDFIKGMDWGMNTDFQRVFDEILKVAVDAKMSERQMVKRVFVFSDMEFDQASSNPWRTDYQVIKDKFKEKGYKRVPEIVFWNLRNSSATPVKATENGVALLSGFSKNLMTLFLEEGGAMNPLWVMERAISGEDYQKLVVYD